LVIDLIEANGVEMVSGIQGVHAVKLVVDLPRR
jgi:hypothetical protein